MTDTQQLTVLVENAQRGDRASYDRIVRRFQDMAVGYGYSVLGDFHLAEDAAQEALFEAYRDLANLRTPAAFPGWLRKIVFKHCDRLTRGKRLSTVPLDVAFHLFSPFDDPTRIVEEQAARALVRAAVRELPPPERAVTTLYYMGEYAHREIAAFLDMPVTTVKSRLHAARQRLKEKLMEEIVENTLRDERPSRNDRFASGVLAEIMEEYRRQHKANPAAADRSLLERARTRLEQHLADKSLEPSVVRAGRSLLSRQGEYGAAADLLSRYLTQPLSVDEEAWARWHLVNSLAMARRCEETVAAQQAFYAWAQQVFPTRPPLLLSRDDPYEPLAESSNGEAALGEDSLYLWVMGGTGEPAFCWNEAGRGNEWLGLFEEAMARTPATSTNRRRRFSCLRIAARLLVWMGKTEEAIGMTQRIGALAQEETDWDAAAVWTMESLYEPIAIHGKAGNVSEALRLAAQATALIEEYEQRVSPLTPPQESHLRGFCHNLACAVVSTSKDRADDAQYGVAIPLFRNVIERGRGSSYAYLRFASALWAMTKDRSQTLPLLQEAAYRDDSKTLWEAARNLPEFADVADDPEFQTAAAAGQ